MGFKRSWVRIPPARDVSIISMFYVYVLRSSTTGVRYVGSCQNRDERVRRHNAGHSRATRNGVPWVLVHSERFNTRAKPVRRELYFKSGRGRDELDKSDH